MLRKSPYENENASYIFDTPIQACFEDLAISQEISQSMNSMSLHSPNKMQLELNKKKQLSAGEFISIFNRQQIPEKNPVQNVFCLKCSKEIQIIPAIINNFQTVQTSVQCTICNGWLCNNCFLNCQKCNQIICFICCSILYTSTNDFLICDYCK